MIRLEVESVRFVEWSLWILWMIILSFSYD